MTPEPGTRQSTDVEPAPPAPSERGATSWEHIPALSELHRSVARVLEADIRALVARLEALVPRLSGTVGYIYERTLGSVAIVGTDGGSDGVSVSSIEDITAVRAADSLGAATLGCIITPETDVDEIGRDHIERKTPLGRLLADLGVEKITQLVKWSGPDADALAGRQRRPPTKLMELFEWSILYTHACYSTWSQPTLLLKDGLLRSVMFRGAFFREMMRRIEDAVRRRPREQRIYVAAFSRRNALVDQLQLAVTKMALQTHIREPFYIRVSEDVQREIYRLGRWQWAAALLDDPMRSYGVPYLARFGSDPVRSPVAMVDLLPCHAESPDATQEIFGVLLYDARNGFPTAHYPLSLQKARAHASFTGFSGDIVRRWIIETIERAVGADLAPAVEQMRLRPDAALWRDEE
jgi:hypothetical protein